MANKKYRQYPDFSNKHVQAPSVFIQVIWFIRQNWYNSVDPLLHNSVEIDTMKRQEPSHLALRNLLMGSGFRAENV